MRNYIYTITISILLASCKSSHSTIHSESHAASQSFSKRSTKILNIFPYSENGLWGFNTKDGSKLVEAQYEDAFLPKYGLAKVKNKDKYGFVDQQGELRIKCKYKEASDFAITKWTEPPLGASEVKAKFRRKTFFIDEFGDKTTAISKDSIEKKPKYYNFKGSLNHHIISKNNFNELKFKYQIESENRQKKTIYDTTNFNLDTVLLLSNKVFVCKKNGKYGILFPYQLNGIPVDGSTNRKHIYKEGEYQPKFEYLFDDLQEAYNKHNQKSLFYFKVKKGAKWGVIDVNGVVLAPFKYLSIVSIEESGAALVEYEENKFGYVSTKSQSRKSIKYKYSKPITPKYSIVEHFKR